MRIFDLWVVADWEARLLDLTQLAEPERWTYRHVPDSSALPILDSYIRYTFIRLSEQGRLAIADRVACFNTGLLTSSQEEIFGLFSVSDRFDSQKPVTPTNKKWFLKAWARAGDRVLTGFSSLPALASYWSDPAELIFNPALQVQLNVDHIVRDNLSRFPAELGGKLGTDGVPGDLSEGDDEHEPVDSVASHGAAPVQQAEINLLPLATRNALEGAMKH